MTTALAKLRPQITDAVLEDRGWLVKAKKLQRGLKSKAQRLLTTDVIRALPVRPWLTNVDTFVNYELDHVVVDYLLLPTAELRFFLGKLAGKTSKHVIYRASRGPGVECYRDRSTLLINTAGSGGVIESWSRCVSISRSTGANAYPKHLHERNYNGGVAKFREGILPRDVEAKVVRHGLGHFDGGRLFFYGRLASAVGSSGRGASRAETDLLKVQLDRVHRRSSNRRLKSGKRKERSEGWEIHMHGYPISESELRSDFPAGATAVMSSVIPP